MNVPIDLDSLKALSDNRLVRQLEYLRGRERKVLAAVLRHLTEMERRRLYLPRGYSSLFEFCTQHLKYSRSAAGRRIAAARTVARFPGLERSLLEGEVNLYTLSLISGIVTEDNFSEVLAGVRNRPTREVEAFTAAYRPARVLKDRVRPVCVMVPEPSGGPVTPGAGSDSLTTETGNASSASRDRSGPPAASTGSTAPAAGSKGDSRSRFDGNRAAGGGNPADSPGEDLERVRMRRMYSFQFTADREFMGKFERMKALLSTKFPRGISFEEMFLLLMDEYIERHSPEGRAARRQTRKKPDPHGSGTDAEGTGGTAAGGGTPKKRTRNIPARVRDEVFLRDGGRCTFIGTDGRRCNSRWDLQIDHIVPFALGGDDSPGNLRLLCGKHNRLEAEKRFGKRHGGRNRKRE